MSAVVRWGIRIGLALAGLAALAVLWILWQFEATKPQVSGQAQVSGISAEVRIMRDAHGVPHIFGSNDADVYFGLGYAHAQDRFFQMDLTRRSVQGRLAEIAGEPALRLDAQARIKGLHLIAESMARQLSPQVRRLMAAYAAGVNARLAQGAPSPEYALLLAQAERWTVEDSVAVAVAMTDNLVGGYEREIARARLHARLSPQQINEFFVDYPDWAPRSIDLEDLPEAARGDAAGAGSGEDGPQNGSNAWVLSARHTDTGAPILANDPHLPFAAPGPFYLARLSLPSGNLVGATLPGAPFIVIGRNEHLAWSNTTNEIDGEDLIGAPEGGFQNVTTREERIRVRSWLFFQNEVTISARQAPQGPILDRAYFTLDMFRPGDIALRSAVLDPNNGLIGSMFDMGRSRNVGTFIAAAQNWTAPYSNVLAASTDGEIGLLSTGRFPLRNDAGAWVGDVPYAAQPNVIHPTRGWIATANNLITPAGYRFPMAGAYGVYRIARIDALLRAGASRTVAQAQDLQMDTVSIYARRILAALLPTAAPASDDGKAALTLLRSWDADMDADSAEAVIYAAWMEEMSRAIYEDELGEALFARSRGPRMQFLDAVLTGRLAQWCDVQGSAAVETCASLAGPALDRAMQTLRQAHGGDMNAWRWGEVHQAVFAHPIFTGAPFIGDQFTVRQAIGGDGDSVSPGAYSYERPYTAVHGAGMRVVYDLADLDRSRFVIAPGQSGHPWSPHFRDLAAMWAAGEGFEIRTDWDREAPPEGMRVLTLRPN